MNKGLFAGLLLAAAAGAMAQQTRSMPPPAIGVSVNDGQISVSSTGVRTSASQSTVSWEMKTSGYIFSSSSINFGDAQHLYSCSIYSAGLGIRCTKSTQDSGRYNYSITLVDANTGAAVVLPQPIIFIQSD